MPIYTYTCEEKHTFDRKGRLNESEVRCACGLVALRHAVYREQGVVFKGDGFTKSVLPPAAPMLPSTKGEKTGIAFEKQDEFASKQYKHDMNMRPYIVKEAKSREKRRK